MKHVYSGAALLLAALAFPSLALAHVSLAVPAALGGSYYVGAFRLSHGCGVSPTVSVRIDIPTEIDIARPQPKPGWALTVTRQRLAKPIQSEGGMVSDRVSAITWTGKLPADQFDEFAIMMRLPPRGGALYFPVVQTCAEGERRWTDIPKPGARPANPAAVLQLAAPSGQQAAQEHHH